MKKKITVLTAAALCAASALIGAGASDVIETIQAQLRPDFTVMVEGDKKTFKNVNGETVYPVLYEGTTYLPLRAIGELMGKTVYWYEDDKLIELKEEKSTVTDADVIVTGDNKDNQVKSDDKDKKTDKTEPDKKEAKADIPEPDIPEPVMKAITEKWGFKQDELEKLEIKKDDGVYEAEFVKDGVKYEIEIKASDGSVVKYEAEKDD